MGGDDSQKLMPWRGAYSSPGRSRPPAYSRDQHLSQSAFVRALELDIVIGVQ